MGSPNVKHNLVDGAHADAGCVRSTCSMFQRALHGWCWSTNAALCQAASSICNRLQPGMLGTPLPRDTPGMAFVLLTKRLLNGVKQFKVGPVCNDAIFPQSTCPGILVLL